MKKLLGILFAFCLTVFPTLTYAAEEAKEVDLANYTTLNLKEVLAAEKMEEKFKSYKETDDQITIYLFRGEGCTYCRAFLTFLNGITEEYGKYFKVVSFETWYSEDNSTLLQNLSEFLENPAQGVPYIIIGDQVFPGYASDYDEGIKSAIKNLYDSEERYDVITAYNENLKNVKKAEFAANNRIIFWNLGFVILGTAAVIFYVNFSNKRLLQKLLDNNVLLEDKKPETDEKPEEKKKPVKKVTKKAKK